MKGKYFLMVVCNLPFLSQKCLCNYATNVINMKGSEFMHTNTKNALLKTVHICLHNIPLYPIYSYSVLKSPKQSFIVLLHTHNANE